MQVQVFQSEEYGFPYDPELQKRVEDKNDSSAYDYIPEIPRLFLRSHIFGGSHLREQRKVLSYDIKTKSLVNKVVTTPKLQERVYLEIISNAIDAAFKAQRMGYRADKLDIIMNNDTISVRSTGIPVPVDIHKYFYSQGQFGTVAELIFGVIGAGSNTDDSVAKQGGGQNGYGAKLCGVFGRNFEVEIGDNIRGFHQKVIWRKNLTEKVSSVITPNYRVTDRPDQNGLYHIYPVGQKYTGENFVKVTWKQDFRKFGCTSFSEEDMQLYMKYAVEASYIAKLRVSFNEHIIDCKSASQYVNMLPKSLTKNHIIHYEIPPNFNISGKQLEDAIANQQIIASLELIVLDTPGQENIHISYCNGIYNIDGGEHTDTAYREVLKVIKEIIQGTKGFDKGIDLSKLNIKDIRNQCTIIINYRCNDPIFRGQDKEKLLKPAPKIAFTADEIIKIKKWNLVNAIYSIVSGKNLKGVTGTHKNRIKDDENFRDAQWFNDPRKRHEAVMILCEGKSAGAYIKQWILGTPERTAKYAYFLLRGKFRNVTDQGLLEMMEVNEEVRKLVEYMGFQYGVDYRTAEGLASLRYGYWQIMVDADSDGSHIKSLLWNFVFRFFPTFFMAGRIISVDTPVIRIYDKPNGKDIGEFYNMFDYKEFVKTGQKHHPKYFKGLASSKTTYAKQDAVNCPIIFSNFDELAGQTLDIAFKKEMRSMRKNWISTWRDKIDTKILHRANQMNDKMLYVNVSDYLNTKLVEYSLDTFPRALPSVFDGFKKSQRQVIWYILMKWEFGRSKKGEVNIESIALGAKEMSKYHHGDLTDTLARTGSNYPGSNNIPLISQDGQFGTREQLGNDIGASRYVETKPEEIFKYIFDEELMKLIPANIVEDKEVEPKYIPTKIPLHIINGFCGVATAYSTESPSYHPLDVIQWVINYITGQMCFPMIPWFRGFTGIVELENYKGRYKKDKDLVMENQEFLSYYEGLTLVTKGLFQVVGERQATYNKDLPDGKKEKVTGIVRDIFVSEIPIGVATKKWMIEIDKHCDNIDDTYTLSTDTPKVMIQGWKEEVNEKSLKLVERIGMCNITLIDNNSYPIQMRNIYEALKMYCDNMKDLYQLLKNTRLKKLEEDIIAQTKIIKLINLLLNDQIITKKQKESYIEQQLLSHGIEFEVYEKLPRKSESEEGYNKNIKKLEDLQAEHTKITNRHHLSDWCDDLSKIYKFIQKDPTYVKLQHHVYPFIPTSVENLITGKVKSPFQVKDVQMQVI